MGWERGGEGEVGNVQNPFLHSPSLGSGCCLQGVGYSEGLSLSKCQIGSPFPAPGHMARNGWSTGAAPGDIILGKLWGRSSGGGHGNPLQYSYLENPHG